MSERRIIFHYHLFKNAGTSVDETLRENFPNKFLSREFSGPMTNRHAHVRDWVLNNPDAVVFSSHTAPLPPPNIQGTFVFPIIFIRHPIDRIFSAYSFERQQKGVDTFGAILAKETTFSGYVKVRLSLDRDRQCRNFQSSKLSNFFPFDIGTEQERAFLALKALPFVGVVEHYSESIQRLEDWLMPEFPSFTASLKACNMNRHPSIPLEARLSEIHGLVGETLWNELEQANVVDILLWNQVRVTFRQE